MQTRTISDSDRRLYMCAPSLCLAETITSLIETKTIADRHFARGRSSRDETSVARRVTARTVVDLSSFYCSQIECRFLAGSRKRSKSEGRSPCSIYQNASGCAASSPPRRSLRAYGHETLLTTEDSISPHTPLRPPFPLYDAAPTKGYLGVCCIFAWGYASTRICSRTRAPAAVPLIL